MTKRVWTMATLSIALSVASCTGSHKLPPGDAGPTDAGSAKDAGKKTDAGKTDAGKTDSGSMMMTAMPVPCGTNMCQPPAGLGALAGAIPGGAAGGLGGLLPMVSACCVDATMGTCGTMGAGGACMVPPKNDPRCPGVFGMMDGCCTADNKCGLDASMFAMGCVDLATVAAGPLGGFLMVPPPQACNASGSGDDAGAGHDAGN